MLKIGIIVDQLFPGGVQKCAIAEVYWLNKAGFEAKLLILGRQGFKAKFQNLVKNVPYEFLSDRYPAVFRQNFKLPFFNFLSILHLISPIFAPLEIGNSEFDLVISHGTTTTLTARSVRIWRKIPYFTVIHDPMVYIFDKIYSRTKLKSLFFILAPIAKFLETQLIKAAKVSLVDSKVHFNFLKKNYGVEAVINYLGCKPVKKIPGQRGLAILSFSRWDKGKNPQTLLKLAQKLPQTKFIIAGVWTLAKDLLEFKNLIKNLKLGKQIELLPYVPEKDLAKLYEKALVYLHPHFEAFGVSALEAAAFGCPVIIPAGSGVTEILEDGKDGFFPKNDRVAQLLPFVRRLIKNPQKAYEAGKSAFKKAKRYTWKNHSKKIIELVKNIENEKRLTKIAILETAHTSSKLLAGGDVLIERLAKFFPQNYQIKLIITSFGIGHWRKAGINFEEHILPKNPFDGRTNPFQIFAAYLARTWQSFLILRKLDINLIISTTDIMPDILPVFLLKIFKPKIPWIAWVHHLIPPPHKRPGNKIVNLGSYFMQLTSLVALKLKANSTIARNSEIANMLKKFGFSYDKLKIISTGVDFSKIKNHKISQNYHFDGVFLGRVHPTKGIFDLPEIWSQVVKAKPAASLVVICTGEKKLVDALKNEVKQLNLNSNVKILSKILSDQQKFDILKTAKVFLFTDYEAGFSLAAAEAMAAGMPVVAYHLPIFGQTYKKGFITVPKGNKYLMGQEIVRLLKNESLRQNLGNQAVGQARALDRSKTVVSFLKLVNGILYS